MAKDQFGSLLTESHEDLYNKKVSVVDFQKLTKKNLMVEWALKGDDLIIHLYTSGKWPFNYAKRLYGLMDKHAPGENRDIGYEDLPNSWYILSKGYVNNKLSPESMAKELCSKILDILSS